MANTPDLLELAPQIRCPSLYVVGAEESPEFYPVEEFKQHASGKCSVERVHGLEHFYRDGERLVGPLVARWLTAGGYSLP